MTFNELPGSQAPFKLDFGQGLRFVFGNQLATTLARREDLGIEMGGTILSGAKGAHFPLHVHASSFEAIYVLEGQIAFTLGDKLYSVAAGDYVSIPPGTVHGFRFLDHRGKLIAWTFGGNANSVYAALGEPYTGTVYPASASAYIWPVMVENVDIEFVDAGRHTATETSRKLEFPPEEVVPYVLAVQEGERMLAAEQMFTVMGPEKASGGLFFVLMCEGPSGPAIPKHMHEHVTETFFCINGELEMLAGDQVVRLAPGDFLHIPPRTPHRYQMMKDGTRFIGFLSPGGFEMFFRYLCQPYDGYTYPLVPPPFRFDRVMQHIAELDLKVLERPAGAPPQA